MNWLAHVLLSEPNVEFRLGNLLADLVRGEQRVGMPREFVRGAEQHKAIDAFTDSHPVVRVSRGRVSPRFRRFSGVLVDIFYDHCLARDWSRYVDEPLDAFTQRFYAEARARRLSLPDDASRTLDRIIRYDLLGQYVDIGGVESSLRRVSTYLRQRWRRDFRLEEATGDLVQNEAKFAADFAQFFPLLKAHVEAREVKAVSSE